MAAEDVPIWLEMARESFEAGRESERSSLDGLGGERGQEDGRRRGEATPMEDEPELLDRTGDAFFGGVFVEAETLADLLERFLLEKTQEHGAPIGFGKFFGLPMGAGADGPGTLASGPHHAG